MESAASEPCILRDEASPAIATLVPLHWKGVYMKVSFRAHTCDTYWTKQIDQFQGEGYVTKQNWTLINQSLQSYPVSHLKRKKPEMSQKTLNPQENTHIILHEIGTKYAQCPSQHART